MNSDKSAPRPVRLADIAKRAKCSVAAVSHALTGSGAGRIRVRPQRIKEIQKLADQMGYLPNHAARQLAGKGSGIIGVLTEQLLTTTHSRMLAWLQHHAFEHGLHVMLAQTNNEKGKLKRAVDEFTSRGIDGMIYNAYLSDAHWAEAGEILDPVSPLVSVFGRPPIKGGLFVDVDIAEGGALRRETSRRARGEPRS